jgi:hypothetical protein
MFFAQTYTDDIQTYTDDTELFEHFSTEHQSVSTLTELYYCWPSVTILIVF